MIVYKKGLTDIEVLNFVIQIAFDIFLVKYFGIKSLLYFILGSLLAMGCHPCAGHFIAEHYVFTPGQETYSYTGPLNYVTFNVGYHVEHHDFPFIPGDKLPLVRKIAPEYYDEMRTHTSWVWVLWQFVTNPAMGPYARIKRKPRVEPVFNGVNALSEYVDAFLCYIGYYQLKSWFSPKSNNALDVDPISSTTNNAEAESFLKQG